MHCSEGNFSITDLEVLVLVLAIKSNHVLLVNNETVVRTDHVTLTSLKL
jgi:hypothetical protein